MVEKKGVCDIIGPCCWREPGYGSGHGPYDQLLCFVRMKTALPEDNLAKIDL